MKELDEFYRLFEEDFGFVFAEYVTDNLLGLIDKKDKIKLRKTFYKSYKVSDIFNILFKYLSRSKRIELNKICNSDLFINENLPSLIVFQNEIIYRFVNGKGLIIADCEILKISLLKNIFYIGDNLCLFNFNENKIQITPGIFKEGGKINISTKNGKDWIKHYLSKKADGYLYFIKFKFRETIGYKIGITKNIENRLANLKKHLDIITYDYEKGDMLEMAIKERAYHEKLKTKRLFIEDNFEGSNECYYTLPDSTITLDNSLDILESNNYGLSKNLLQFALKERNENKNGI